MERRRPRTRNEWLSKASQVHAHLTSVQQDIDTIFPNQEYLHPLSRVPASQQLRIAKFLNFKISRLAKYEDIKEILAEATTCSVDKGNILYVELLENLEKARSLRKDIRMFEGLNHRTYAEAKHLFAQILKLGIWMHAARVVKKIINVNTKVENFLMGGNSEESVNELRKLTQKYQEFIDSGFKMDISSKHAEIKETQKCMNRFLNKPYVEFSDFVPLEELIKENKSGNYMMPKYNQLTDLHKSFVWVIKLALKFEIKTKSLANLANQIRHKVDAIKNKPEFEQHRAILRECETINYSKSPLNDIIQETKLIFWEEIVRDSMKHKNLSIEELQNLLERLPYLGDMDTSDVPSITLIQALVDNALEWKIKIEEIEIEITKLTKISPNKIFSDHTKGKLGKLERQIEELINDYKKNLSDVKDLKFKNSVLHEFEEIVFLTKVTHSLTNNVKIELNDYKRSKQICQNLAKHQKSGLRLGVVLDTFRTKQKQLESHMKVLKIFYLSIHGKKKRPTPDIFEPKFLHYIKNLLKKNELEAAVDQVSKFVFLGDLGFEIKQFLKKFKNSI